MLKYDIHKGVEMLDKISTLMLKIIVEASPDGESVIIEQSDLLAKVRELVDADREELKEASERLAAGGLINIVYQDDEALGVASLTKGRAAAERISISKKADLVTIKSESGTQIDTNKIFQFAFMGALIGSIIGSAIIAIIMRLI